MRSLDILMVASEGPPTRSGIARTITHLRDGFATRGHRVEVVSFPRIPRAVFGEVRLSGLLFHQRGLGRQLDEYDVVHVHGSAPTVSDVFLLFSKLRGRRAPLVYTHHCDIEVGPARQLNTLYNRLHHRLSSKFGVPSVRPYWLT
jgi:glycosyltransferase involved in cell wall biosynthesis